MSNKYLVVNGTDIIKNYPPRITKAFDDVETDVNSLTSQIQSMSSADSNAQIGVYSLNATGIDTLTASFTGLTYFIGLKLNLKLQNDNTAGVTVNINSLGAKNIYKVVKGVKVALSVRDLRVGEIATVEYDGTDFILLNGEREPEYSTEEESFADITPIASTSKGNMEKCQLEGQTATNLVAGTGIINTGTVTFASKTGNRYYSNLSATIIEGTGADITLTNNTGATVDVLVIDMGKTGSELYTYTVSQMNTRFPSFFDGTKSVDKVRVLNVGKNIFNQFNASFLQGFLDDNGNFGVSAASLHTLNFYPVFSSAPYTLTRDRLISGEMSTRIYFYDSSYKWISRTELSAASNNAPIIFTTPNNCKFIRLQVRNAFLPFLDGIQIEKGSTATTLTPYKPTQSVCPLPLRSISTTIKDTFDALEGAHRQNVSEPQSIATTVYASIDLATYTNVDVVKTTAFTTAVAGTVGVDGRTRVYNKDGVELEEVAQADIDLVASVGKYYYHTDKTIWFIIADALYVDIAAARTGLGTSIAYLQLATPIVKYFPSRVLGAEAGGTMYQEPFIEDWAFFDGGLALTDVTKPIVNLVEVRKWNIENGSYVIVPLSNITITTGVITAITGAVAGEFYTFDYNYSSTLSLNAGITYSHPVNAMGQIDVNTKSVVAIDRKTADMEKVIDNLLARIEVLETAP